MKVEKNVTFFAGENSRSNAADRNKGFQQQQSKQEKTGSIFAGNTNLMQDSILLKKQQAQKQAMKVVGDVWAGDRKLDDDLNQRRDHINNLRRDMADASKELGNIEAGRDKLKETYGIQNGSQEQKDLELLVKRSDSKSVGSETTLSEEDQTRLKEIDAQGMTDYQARSLEMYEGGNPYRTIIRDSQEVIMSENAVIRGVKKERLKSAPMEAAAQQKEDILEAASKEIVGMLIEEGKEKVDQEQKEKEEAAEEVQEKKEAQEELLESGQEEKSQAEELVDDMPADDILKLDQAQNDVQKEVQKIMDQMKLVTEDIKGAMVDRKL